METQKLLFEMIRCVLCEQPPQSLPVAQLTPQALDRLYRLAKGHDLAHIVGHGLCKLNLPDCEEVTLFKQAAMAAAVRDAQREYAFCQVCNTLEEGGFAYIPLKGAVLAAWYPKSWMRTSCDIDILVREEDLEAAAELLVKAAGCQRGDRNSHDIAMRTPEGVELELHYATIEDAVSKSSRQILSAIWEQATPVTPGSCRMVIPDDLFYYYHMAHMAKHIIGGGCGIRPVLDTWILQNRVDHAPGQREALLKKGKLDTFARAVEKLSRIWFDGEEGDAFSLLLEEYILSGGSYGCLDNRVAINRKRQGGKLRYALGRIFLPYEVIKYHYPILLRHKYLLPWYQAARWVKLLRGGAAGRSVKELQKNSAISEEKIAAGERLLAYLDL